MSAERKNFLDVFFKKIQEAAEWQGFEPYTHIACDLLSRQSLLLAGCALRSFLFIFRMQGFLAILANFQAVPYDFYEVFPFLLIRKLLHDGQRLFHQSEMPYRVVTGGIVGKLVFGGQCAYKVIQRIRTVQFRYKLFHYVELVRLIFLIHDQLSPNLYDTKAKSSYGTNPSRANSTLSSSDTSSGLTQFTIKISCSHFVGYLESVYFMKICKALIKSFIANIFDKPKK